jgi:hypothetical protein
MCCCCCPPAISALFCLWVQSGFSKGTVAGALTFFPPEPALYQFERHSKSGRVLAPDEEEEEDDDDDDEHVESEDTKKTDKSNDNGATDDDGAVGATANEKPKPFELQETRAKTQKKLKSPVEQLTDQASERRRRSAARNARDARDAQKGVSFRLLLDPRLSVPPHDEHAIAAVKIPSPRGVYIAAVVYRVPLERQTLGTKTILISHGKPRTMGPCFQSKSSWRTVWIVTWSCTIIRGTGNRVACQPNVPRTATWRPCGIIPSIKWRRIAVAPM